MNESVKFETKTKESNPDVPAIYKLIENRADSQAIVQQLYNDFYNPEKDPEKIYLAIDELQSRDLEGESALNYLATATDELGSLIKKVQQDKLKGSDLEALLDIKRFTNIIESFSSESELVKKAYEHAKKNKYTDLSFSECVEQRKQRDYFNYLRGSMDKSSHLRGVVDQEVVIESATFGTDETGYMELLGPREILRLRSMSDPSFLLLGSYGVYSAKEFRNYANKINSTNKSYVIDINNKSINKLANDPSNKDTLVQADARKLPFKDATMDHIYTNRLFHFLGKDEIFPDKERDINYLLKESFRVLNDNGSLVLVESLPNNSIITDEKFFKAVISMANKIGFRVEKMNESVNSFIVRAEAGSTIIDSNGFPHYGNSLLLKHSPFFPVGIRLVKLK